MEFLGRSRELGAIREALDQRRPSVVRVSGLPGVGKSALVRRAAEPYAGLAWSCPPLPDPSQRASLNDALVGASATATGSPGQDPVQGGAGDPLADAGWPELFDRILGRARVSEGPFVLLMDDAHRLSESRARWIRPLERVLVAATDEGVALHVVLAGREAGLPELGEAGSLRVRVPPLPLRVAAPLLPGNAPHHVVRAYGVFGGIPRVLSRLDTSVTVGTNVRRLVLDPDGPLADAPVSWLEREVQTPSRYLAILRTLAFGETDWGGVHEGVPDLTRSGQAAPYLKRLEQLGMIEVRTALDAKPGSRSARYALTDPFVAFWFRFALPWRASRQVYESPPPLREHYAGIVRPGIAEHMERTMPALARRHMEREALGTVGASARECGSLWGPNLDVPAAGILANGAAFYGTTSWARPERDASPLIALDAAVRETRFGFGREHRLRLVFAGQPAPTWLRREIARRPDAVLVEANELLGR